MSNQAADVVICGAGIAGVAAAYHLAAQHGLERVVVVDERPPLTLTSDKSTECYRNWWPGPGAAMVGLMNRSIDWLERWADESDNFFHLNRRGYLYVTTTPEGAATMRRKAQASAALGAGELREHTAVADTYQPAAPGGYHQQPDGADLLVGADLIRRYFPYVKTATAALHARRAGWLSAQQLGMYLWQQAKEKGARLVNGRVSDILLRQGAVSGVQIHTGPGQVEAIATTRFVNAAGPWLGPVARLMGVDLPVSNELHGKMMLEDPLGIIPRHAPMLIYDDAITLPWRPEEREFLAEDEATRPLLAALPPGAHLRPEGGPGSQTLLMLWDYHREVHETPQWTHQFAPEYAEVVLRGLAQLAPGLSAYVERMSKPQIDGGYYTRTPENRPLIGPLPVAGAFALGALSGYGIMAAAAAGELLAAHVTGAPLPAYAPAFSPDRYDDPEYQVLLSAWGEEDGQL